MGISRGAVYLLGRALQSARRAGSVITLGVQKIEITHDEALRQLSKAGIEPSGHQPHTAGPIQQDALFRLLGYDAVESIDYYPAESPTHVLDLNRPVPDQLHDRFDLVYDGGTTEHCFAAAEVLSNAVRLLRPGGHLIHHVPINNWVDHGFYQFSPGLFFDFYEANGFDQLDLALHLCKGDNESFIPYDPGIGISLPYALGGKAPVLAFFSARKSRAGDAIAYPVQARYRRAFGTAASAPGHREPRLARLRRSLLKRTLLLRAKRC